MAKLELNAHAAVLWHQASIDAMMAWIEGLTRSVTEPHQS